MKDPYSILGISPDATDEEIKNAYRNLARKYHPDNFTDDNPLKELAEEKMQEINSAYDEIQKKRKKRAKKEKSSYDYSEYQGDSIYAAVRQKISENRYKEAENMLFTVPVEDRVAEWHFLCSVCLLQRNRPNEAMRELEIACSMDPSNQEYQRMKEMFNNAGNRYGSAYYDNRGGRNATNDACDCCANLICLDCLCECMGGDLIRCI